ncbi:dynein axonemal intermediate chain 3-like [Oncorhynchus masou masou]|uniref:dynein axonemal intermediate chain 3-like n=1 Tax=Oncorhynchus masou masou TaxID=90313 RepID=UPI003183F36A
MFWDICSPRPWPTRGRQRRNPWRILTEFPTPSNTSTWKPLFRVSLPKINSDAEYSPLTFSLRDNTCDNHTGGNADRSHLTTERPEVVPKYALLRVPSAKQLKPLEDISTRFYAGTEDREIVYTDWKLEKGNDSGRLFSKVTVD